MLDNWLLQRADERCKVQSANRNCLGQLIINRATVKFHVSSILSKLGVASRTEAAALAVQRQLDSGTGDLSIIWPAKA